MYDDLSIEEMLNYLYPSSALPSKDMSKAWMRIYGSVEYRPTSTDFTGKWLFYCPPAEIDAVWAKVARAVQLDAIGWAAKTSTRAGMLRARKPTHVICVYTYDYRDFSEICRIGKLLSTILNNQYPLSYKRDVDTREGRDKFIYSLSVDKNKQNAIMIVEDNSESNQNV